jgi:methyl-accepting chemotaxis protein
VLARIGIRTQLALVVLIAALSVSAVAAAAFYAAMRGASALEAEHHSALQPLVALNRISTLMRETGFRIAGVLIDQIPIEGSKNHATGAAPEVAKLWSHYVEETKKRGAVSPEELELIEKGDKGSQIAQAFFTKLIAAYEKKDKKALEGMFEEDWPAVHGGYVKELEKLIPLKEAQSRAMYEKNSVELEQLRTAALAVGAGSVFLLVLFSALLFRVIVRSLVEVSSAANRIAEGDLGVRVKTKRRDEIGKLVHSVNAMAVNLESTVARILSDVRTSSDAIATATKEIAAGNQDLARRTEVQVKSLEDTTSNVQELAATVAQNAEHAQQANELAISASSVATRGGEVVGEVVKTMSDINDSARRIVDIIGVIDGIAFQTNILALNAAVEAARAGEQGRGFAVVASEVRSLAQRSATAAKEIKALIDSSVSRIDVGARLVEDAGTTMNEILESVKRVTSIMGEITAATREQSNGIAELNDAVSSMNEATRQNAALVEQSAASADHARDRAEQLVKSVQVFKLANGEAAAQEESAGEASHAHTGVRRAA